MNPKITNDSFRNSELDMAYKMALEHINKKDTYNETNRNLFKNEEWKHKSHRSNKKVKIVIITVSVLSLIIVTLMSIAIIRIVLKDNIPIQVRNEVSSCLLHSRPENDGFNIDLLEDTLVDKGYSNFEIGGNTSYSFLYANIMTNDHKVEFYHSGTDERGYCNIYIETQTQVEIDGETYYYTSKVMNSGDDLEIFSVYFYLAESEIAIDYIQSVDVLVDFKEGDIIFDKIDDEDIINKYYNYDYIKNQVEILNSEIERLNK